MGPTCRGRKHCLRHYDDLCGAEIAWSERRGQEDDQGEGDVTPVWRGGNGTPLGEVLVGRSGGAGLGGCQSCAARAMVCPAGISRKTGERADTIAGLFQTGSH